MVAVEKEEIRTYWDARAGSYTHEFGHGFFNPSEFDFWTTLVEQNLPRLQGRAALDLGTGPGFMALVLSRLGFQAVGLDVSEAMLDCARKNAVQAGLSAEFRQGDAEAPFFPPLSFDLIICRHLMWTLTEMARTLGVWNELLRPGGALIIIDGVWGEKSPHSAWRRLAAQVIRAVRNRQWPSDWKRRYVSDQNRLPYLDGVQPEAVITALETSGFGPIRHDPLDELRLYEQRQAPWSYRLLNGHCPRYLIVAGKDRLSDSNYDLMSKENNP